MWQVFKLVPTVLAQFMVHRRIQFDDSRGVGEPLNETMHGITDYDDDQRY